MTRVLVIGAGGVFGERLAQGLLANGFDLVVAGRDPERLAAATAHLGRNLEDGRVVPVRLDTATLTAEALKGTGAAIVVDAAGPFQDAAPRTARAAIAAGLHYVDLADARGFVADFPSLDAQARAAGVVALTGCSSTPALSNAVLDELTRGWREVVSVEAAISPGARAPRGPSVMRAILSWMGRPVRVFEGGGWTQRAGWSGLHRRDFGRGGWRRVSLCETPDLDLFVARFQPHESALFMAGLSPVAAHVGAWLLGWVVRVTGLDLRPCTRALIAASGLFCAFGSDRGAMRVAAYGVDHQGRAVRAFWRLEAEPGAGPVTPSLPALAAIKAIAKGHVAPGARACVGVLPLEMLEAEITAHPIRTIRQVERGALFARAIGPAFDDLPPVIRALHETPGRSLWRGEAQTTGAQNPVARFVARLFGFPPSQARCPVQVEVRADGDRAVWRRRIGGHAFSSVLSRPRPGGGVSERFGLLSFDLTLTPVDGRLVYAVRGWRLGPVPLPLALAPRTTTCETMDDQGRFVFDVDIALPWAGRLVHYRGWLERAG